MKKLTIYLKLFLGVGLLVFSLEAQTINKWPLKNGDFSRLDFGGKISDWAAIIQTGAHQFSNDQSAAYGGSPAVITIETTEKGRAYFEQTVFLVPGNYRFRVEAKASAGSLGMIEAAGVEKTISPSGSWATQEVLFTANDFTNIRFGSLDLGRIDFKNARVEVISLPGTTITADDGGSAYGKIVTLRSPSLCDQYASYELQKYLYKMTGKVLGVEGRDSVQAGRGLYVGTSTSNNATTLLAGKLPEAYVVEKRSEGVVLAGNTPRGTLYAVYDFLKTQGCGWYLPGDLGEVVPSITRLAIPATTRVENPHYQVRGYFEDIAKINQGRIFSINLDDYLDWGTRNGLNAFWLADAGTVPFEEHRGFGHTQTLNHSYDKFLLDEHPEWWPLVDGQRVKIHTSGRYNQLELSSSSLRDYAVSSIAQHFQGHPNDSLFALNPNDEPAFWSESTGDRALDSDLGQGVWIKTGEGVPSISMSDRVIDFTNEAARRVSVLFPGKRIELYCYGSYRKPPTRQNVDPNVLIKYSYWPKPFNRALLDVSVPANVEEVSLVNGWKNKGVQHFALYDYNGGYDRNEAPILRFYHVADSFKTFYQQWGFEHSLGEFSNNPTTAFMMYYFRARLLWNTGLDYRNEIRSICRGFFGPAGAAMTDYYLYMDDVLMNSKAGDQPGWNPNALREYTIAEMKQGKTLLDRAAVLSGGDAKIKKRIGLAQFGHDYMTMMIAQDQIENLTHEDEIFSQESARRAQERVVTDQIGLKQVGTGVGDLANFYLKPRVREEYLRIENSWYFKSDPENQGVAHHWEVQAPDASWASISIEKDWTDQGLGGLGVGWYSTQLQIPVEQQAEILKATGFPAIYFESIDGIATVYLDGAKIGERTQEGLNGRSMAVELPAGFDPATSHRLTVRVVKNDGKAGIYRPVSLVALMEGNQKSMLPIGEELYRHSNAAVGGLVAESNGIDGWNYWWPQYLTEHQSVLDSGGGGQYSVKLKGWNGGTAYYSFATTPGHAYRLRFKTKISSGYCAYLIRDQMGPGDPLTDPNSVLWLGQTDWIEKELYFTARATTSYFAMRCLTRSGQEAENYLDQVSLREVKERSQLRAISDELHQASNAASDPKHNESLSIGGWSSWGDQYRIDFSATAPASRVAGSGLMRGVGYNGFTPYYSFGTIPGRTYRIQFSAEVKSGSCLFLASSALLPGADPVSNALATESSGVAAMGEKSVYFTATQNTSLFGIRFAAGLGQQVEVLWDNLSIREMGDPAAIVAYGNELHVDSNAASAPGKAEALSTSGWPMWGGQYGTQYSGVPSSSVVSGSWLVQAKGRNGFAPYYGFNTVPGKIYKISAGIEVKAGTVTMIVTDQMVAGADPAGRFNVKESLGISKMLPRELVFVATSATSYVAFRLNAAAGKEAELLFDNVSIREAMDTTKLALKNVELYSASNAASDAISQESESTTGWNLWGRQYVQEFKASNVMRSMVGSYHLNLKGYNGASAYYGFPTTAGKTYRVRLQVEEASQSASLLICDQMNASQDPLRAPLENQWIGVTSTRIKTILFKATGSESFFVSRLAAAPNQTAEIHLDNISIQEVITP